MTRKEVDMLASAGMLAGKPLLGTVVETHISWVILTAALAIKIKKPLRLSFLDFSTLALRKQYCEHELVLNRRFSDIYLSVQPICQYDGVWVVGGDALDALEYCVVMERLDTDDRMDNRAREHNLRDEEIQKLARKIATFHREAATVYTPFDLTAARNLFNEITSVSAALCESGIDGIPQLISVAAAWSDSFLEHHQHRLQQRIDLGFKRDVHGDLHMGNIFLGRDPVIFDCIEFNDRYRQIDVLYDMAFLSMDLEAAGLPHLAEIFLREYKNSFAVMQTDEDLLLFIYFKALRANVRAKVHALEAAQSNAGNVYHDHMGEARRYLLLMDCYRRQVTKR